jgi:hypothetical protein
MRIFRNGGAYRGLAHYNHRDMAINNKGYPQQPTKPVRIIPRHVVVPGPIAGAAHPRFGMRCDILKGTSD